MRFSRLDKEYQLIFLPVNTLSDVGMEDEGGAMEAETEADTMEAETEAETEPETGAETEPEKEGHKRY